MADLLIVVSLYYYHVINDAVSHSLMITGTACRWQACTITWLLAEHCESTEGQVYHRTPIHHIIKPDDWPKLE